MNFKTLIYDNYNDYTSSSPVPQYLADPDIYFRELPLIDKCILVARQSLLLKFIQTTNTHYLLQSYSRHLDNQYKQIAYEFAKPDCELEQLYLDHLNYIINEKLLKADINVLLQLTCPTSALSDHPLTSNLSDDLFFKAYTIYHMNKKNKVTYYQSVIPFRLLYLSIKGNSIRYDTWQCNLHVNNVSNTTSTALLSDIDWSGMEAYAILSKLAMLGQFSNYMINPNHISQTLLILTKILMPDEIGNYLIRNLTVRCKDIIKKSLLEICRTLKNTYNTKFDDPNMFGRIIKALEGDTQTSKELLAYFTGSEQASTESYTIFKNSDYYYDELDIKINPNFRKNSSTEVSLANEDNTNQDTASDNPDDVTDPQDNQDNQDTNDSQDPPDDSTPDNPDDNKPPAPRPTSIIIPNISNNGSVVLELAPAETLDTLRARLEILNYINTTIARDLLTDEQLGTLKRLKTYWLSLLSVQSLLDIINYTLKK